MTAAPTSPTTEQPAQQLSEKQLKSLDEVRVQVNLKGLLDAWNYITYKKPFAVYQAIARKVEGVSKKMMFGKGSVLSMPAGIVLRNTSRAAYKSSDDAYLHVAQVAGGLAVAGAVVASTLILGPAIAGVIGVSGLDSLVGYSAAAAISGTVLHKPVFTLGTLAASTVLAAGTAAFSALIAAPANLFVAFRRSRASLKGVNLTEEQLTQQKAAFDVKSPLADYARAQEERVEAGITNLPPEGKQRVYQALKAQFEPAVAPAVAKPAAKKPAAPKTKAAAAAKTTPAKTTKTPKQG